MARDLSEKDLGEIMQLIFADKKIDAIKAYRLATRTELKAAKDAVEALQERLWQESPERFASPPGGTAHGGLILIVILVAIGMVIWGIVEWIGAARLH